MILDQDIQPIEKLDANCLALMRRMHRRRRPMLITVDGKPDTLMVPVELLESKRIGLTAACELFEARG